MTVNELLDKLVKLKGEGCGDVVVRTATGDSSTIHQPQWFSGYEPEFEAVTILSEADVQPNS